MEMELAMELPRYSRTLPDAYDAISSGISSGVIPLYNAFELYWLCVLPLLFIGIPLCLSCFTIQEKRMKSIDEENPMINTDKMNVPQHIAVIMDGNRRFGRAKYGIAAKGHHDGSKALVNFTNWCVDAGVKILTVYAFSTENWNRSKNEVDTLMSIFDTYMDQICPEALKKNIRVQVLVSDGRKLPAHIVRAIDDIQNTTKHCTAFTLNLCVR